MTAKQERQMFDGFGCVWDVTAAQEIVRDRQPGYVRVADLVGYIHLGVVAVDKEYAAGLSGPYEPVIIALAPRVGNIPIDGWHKVWKAHLDGVEDLPALLLTGEEEQQVRLIDRLADPADR